MWKPFRKKPAPLPTVVIDKHPCPACANPEYLMIAPINGAEALQCAACKTQWYLARLLENGYTSGKG